MKRRFLPQVDDDELTPKSKKQVGKLQSFTEGLLEEVYAFEDLVARLNDEMAILKGYRDFIVQDMVVTPLNTRYRLAHWQTTDGRHLSGRLPKSLRGGHFGAELVSYILYQHHHCHVTQPLLHEQLREWGIDISSGQIDALLQNGKASFHEEKDALLATGLALSSYVTVDDTGARHQGNNGYVTHIGNPYFAWFQSSTSKSRVNFLELLRAGQTDYRINPTRWLI